MKFYVTFDTVSPDCDGEAIARGWAGPRGWRYEEREGSEWTLRELVSYFGRGGLSEGDGESLSGASEIDYRTACETRYTVHRPEAITPASWARVEAILS